MNNCVGCNTFATYIDFPINLEQLWKYDPESMILSNKKRIWQYEKTKWNNTQFPQNGSMVGLIEDFSKNVLSLKNDGLVVLEPLENSSRGAQMWRRGKSDKKGYFTIETLNDGRTLTATNIGSTVVKGKQ